MKGACRAAKPAAPQRWHPSIPKRDSPSDPFVQVTPDNSITLKGTVVHLASHRDSASGRVER